MELRQRVVAGGIAMEQTAREYSLRDYEDVGEEFICEWLLRRFAGQHVIQATREMLYEYVLKRVGPMHQYPTQMDASRVLGMSRSALDVFKHRFLTR